MKKAAVVISLVGLAAFAAGCFHGNPPRVDLGRRGPIGLVGFRSQAKGNITAYADRVFLEALLEAQPRARIKELGPEEDLLREVGAGRMNPEALEAIGRRYGVDAVLVGTLDLSDIRPKINLATLLVASISVSAEVDAKMSARLLDTRDGTTFWSDSARDRRTIAQVSVFKGGGIFFDARDPEQAYGALIRALVARTTRDFRWR